MTVRDLKQTVPRVTFTCGYNTITGWPREYPKERAFSIVDRCYSFRYRNSNSGERFVLSLQSGSTVDQLLHGWDGVSQIQLKFD